DVAELPRLRDHRALERTARKLQLSVQSPGHAVCCQEFRRSQCPDLRKHHHCLYQRCTEGTGGHHLGQRTGVPEWEPRDRVQSGEWARRLSGYQWGLRRHGVHGERRSAGASAAADAVGQAQSQLVAACGSPAPATGGGVCVVCVHRQIVDRPGTLQSWFQVLGTRPLEQAMKRRDFILSAGATGLVIPALGRGATPCPPPQMSVAGGSTVTTNCGKSYSTNFPGTEDPISENGAWVHLGEYWSVVQTSPGFA